MRAIVYQRYGPPEVLQLAELPDPVPEDDEVLIQIQAAEATKADCEMRSFRYSVKWFWLPLRLALGVRVPRRRVLGGYFAGNIAGVGKNVTRHTVGDAVFGCARLRLGAYAEYLKLPESYTIVSKPENMSFAEAAAVPLGGLNALHFMRLADVQPGERVLIAGAGGSIGAHAVQIAKAMGAEVTGVDLGIKEALVRRLGADHFIDYTQSDYTRAGERFDVIFDMVPGSSYGGNMRSLTANGRYLSGNPRLLTMLRCVLTTRFTARTARFAFAGESREELNTLKALVEEGKVRSIVDREYSMEEAADAHRRVESEERLGAIVIAMTPPHDSAALNRE